MNVMAYLIYFGYLGLAKTKKGMKLSLYMSESFPKLFVMSRLLCSTGMFMAVSTVYLLDLDVEIIGYFEKAIQVFSHIFLCR